LSTAEPTATAADAHSSATAADVHSAAAAAPLGQGRGCNC
jgi:hypothetical protein